MNILAYAKKDIIHFLSEKDRREVIEVATHLFVQKMQPSILDALIETYALCDSVRARPEILSFYQKKGSRDWFLAFYQSNKRLADGLLVRYGARTNQIKRGHLVAVSASQDVRKLRQEVGECLSEFLMTKENVVVLHPRHTRVR